MAFRIAASTPLSALDCVVLDTETTGLDARTARLLQIGAIGIADGQLQPSDRFDQLVNPGIPIPAASTAIHGITQAHVAEAPAFKTIAADFARFIGGRIVVGHTIGYDLLILQREAELAGVPWPIARALDIRALAELVRPSLAQYDLDRLAEIYAVPINGRHTAAGDAAATAGIFLTLLPQLRARGLRTLAQAEAASRSLAERQLAGGIPVLTAGSSAAPSTTLVRVDSFPYRHRLADVMSAPPVWCPSEAPLSEAMRLLLEKKISSVLVAGVDATAGIITERDLLRAIHAGGPASLGQPTGTIASRPLQSLPASAYVYRAIGRISRLGIRHLAVTDEAGRIVGMVTTRDLLRHRASTAIALGDGIDSAETSAALGKVWAELTPMASSLLAEDVDARSVSAVISEEICALTRRAAQLAEAQMKADGQGDPPVPYAVLVLGSAGRGESLLAADQDNAIVYERGEPGGTEDKWLERMAGIMSKILDEVGVPLCKGGVMASKPAWRHSVEAWHGLIGNWIRRQRPEDLLNVDIFFDGVVVHGEARLGEAILSRAFEAARGAPDFIVQLTLMTPHAAPPISWLGNIKPGPDGRVDLKLMGLMPIFSAARVLAVRDGLRARSTPERLGAIAARSNVGDVEALVDAHRVIMAAMLRQQIADAEAGISLSPRVELARLGAKETLVLKSAMQRVSIAWELLNEGRL